MKALNGNYTRNVNICFVNVRKLNALITGLCQRKPKAGDMLNEQYLSTFCVEELCIPSVGHDWVC